MIYTFYRSTANLQLLLFFQSGTRSRNILWFFLQKLVLKVGIPFTWGWLGLPFLWRDCHKLSVFLQSLPDVIIGLSHGRTKMFYGTFEKYNIFFPMRKWMLWKKKSGKTKGDLRPFHAKNNFFNTGTLNISHLTV